MQNSITNQRPERVLFITYRQTLARDIVTNLGTLDFKDYLDSDNDPNVSETPRRIIKLDSRLKLVYKNSDASDGKGFELSYDLIVLDKSENLMSHFDEGTMNKKEIEIWFFLQRDYEARKGDRINGRRH